MIAPTPFFSDRGCHIRIYEEIKALQKLGHKIILCAYHLGRNVKGIDIKRIINISWYKKIDAGPSWHKLYLDFILLCKTIKECYKEKPDVIHVYLHEGAFIGKITQLFSFRKIPLIFDSQGSLASELTAHKFILKNSFWYRLFLWLEKLSYKFSDKIITSSDYLKDFPHTTITDGFNEEMFNVSDDEVESLRKKLNLQNKFVIVYSGGLKQYKGIDIIFQVALEIVKKIPNCIFLMIGYGEIEKYSRLVRSLNLAKNFIFTGRINYFDLPKFLMLGNIAIDPKQDISEGSGKIANYIGAYLPVIAFDSKINRQLLKDIGIFINNKEEIFQKVTEIIKNKSFLTQMKEILLQVRGTYSWNKNLVTLEKIYSNLEE